MIRWPSPSWTSHKCSGGAPCGCPSTPATKSASNARPPQDISRSSSGAPPGARTSGQNGRAFRSPDCATPPLTRLGPCTGATEIFASTPTSHWLPRTESKTSSPRSTATHLHLLGVTPSADSRRLPATTQVEPTTAASVGQFELTSPIVDLRHLSAPPRPTHRYRPQRCRESGCRRARDAALSRCLHGGGSRHPRGLITHRRSSNDYLMVTTGQACRGVRRRSESTCLNYVFADFSARSTIRRSRGPW